MESGPKFAGAFFPSSCVLKSFVRAFILFGIRNIYID